MWKDKEINGVYRSFENLKDFVNEIYKFIIKVDDVSVPTRFDKFSVLGYTFHNEI